MTIYIFRRFLNYAILSLIATCMAYILASIALDPAARFYGMNPSPPQSSIDASLDAMGVNPAVPEERLRARQPLGAACGWPSSRCRPSSPTASAR